MAKPRMDIAALIEQAGLPLAGIGTAPSGELRPHIRMRLAEDARTAQAASAEPTTPG